MLVPHEGRRLQVHLRMLRQRSQGNGLGLPGEPLGACDYSVRGVYMGPKFYACVAMSHDKKCLSHDNNFKTVSVAR